MATSAWLRGPSAMRLTEGLASVLKEQRPEHLPALLASYREHGVFQTQVRLRPPERRVSSAATSPVCWWCGCARLCRSARCLLCIPSAGDAEVILELVPFSLLIHGLFVCFFLLGQNASAVSGLVGFSNAKLGSSKTR